MRLQFRRCLAGLLVLIFIGLASPSWAALTGVTDTYTIDSYTAAESSNPISIAMDVNELTGSYVICWSSSAARLNCAAYTSDDSASPFAVLDIPITLVSFPGLNSLEVALNNQDQFFVTWAEGNESNAFLAGVDSDGSQLFATAQLPGFWVEVAIAVTPDFVWVGGFEADGMSNNVELTAHLYELDGTYSTQLSWSETFVYAPCLESDLASTQSGDVLFTWIRPGASDLCEGEVWARTFLSGGAPITSDIQLSKPMENTNGDPQAIAFDNGEYVISWQGRDTTQAPPALEVQAARLTFDGTVAAPANSLLPIANLTDLTRQRIGGYPRNRDYVVVLGEPYPDTSCQATARLIFADDVTPETVIPFGHCGHGFDVAFSLDGDMFMARTSNQASATAGDIVIDVVPVPAQVEVSSVTVLEGDPARGIGNYATLTTALSKPHPLQEDVSVSYFTRDITAFAGLDYQQTSDTLMYDGMNGQTSEVLQIPIIVDTIYEANELFSVNLHTPVNAVVKNGGDLALVTITNDDITPAILPDCDGGDPTQCRAIQEMGPGEFSDTLITLTLAEPVDLPITINFATQQGGPDPTKLAQPGSDYVDVSGSVQIPAGFTQASFTISVIGDDVPEDTETFQVELSGGPMINLQQPTLTLSILDDNLCFLELDTNALVFDMAGDTMPVALTTLDATCQWTATPTDPWVSVAPPSGSDSQTIMVTADPWDPMGQVVRSTQVTIELTGGNGTDSEIITIDQDGNCDFTTDMDMAAYPADGGEGTIMVTASDPSCDWFVFTDQDWITISSPTSPVSGSGMVTYSVSANGSTNVENDARMAMLMSDEFDFQITQAGCQYSMSPTMVSVAAGGNDMIDINVTGGPSVCQWTAVSNSIWTVIETGASGGGDGTVRLDVLENPSVVTRMGSVSIADEMVAIDQEGQACTFDANPDSLAICPDGEGFEIDVTALAGCEWSLEEADTWLSILANDSGNGDETATGLVEPNLSQMPRTSSVDLISTQSGMSVDTVMVQQQGFLEYEPFDGPLPPDWIFDPMGSFSASGGQLVASLSGMGMGSAIHQNAMGTCSDCKVETTMEVTSVTSQSQEVITLVGWYEDANEYIALGMDEFANTWKLYQVVGGTEVQSNMVSVPQILPNQPYDVAIRYDGTTFRAFVDGAEVVSLERQMGSDPRGYAGFLVNGSNAEFTELRVTGVFRDFEVLLDLSFEDTDTFTTSRCTQQ